MKFLRELRIKERLPVLGIVAFSACSVNSVANLFLERAQHPTQFLWLASGLVELTTAWIVWSVVEVFRSITKSGISKQDRRFYGGMFIILILLGIPPLALSIVANSYEFGDNGLGIIFPLLSVACAVGAALPDSISKFERKRDKERAEDRQKKAEDKAKREKEKEQLAKRQQEMEKLRQAFDNLSGTTKKIFDALSIPDNDVQTKAQLEQALGIKRQTVSYHLKKLEGMGFVRSNGKGIEVLYRGEGNE